MVATKTQTMTATLSGHLNEQGFKFSMITTGISSHIHYLLEEKGVWLLSLSLCGAKTSIKTSNVIGLFFPTSVANETKNLNVWSITRPFNGQKYHD